MKNIKVAVITPFNSACGIATYSGNLIPYLSKYVDIKIFAEKNGITTYSDTIKYCWTRDEWPKFELIDAVDEFKPDIVLFQHEFGLWFKAYYFTTLVSYFKWKKYKVFSTFHSVYEHLDKTVHEACIPNIIIHTKEGKEILIKKGMHDNYITVIPHGTAFYNEGNTLLEPLWNTWNNQHTIFQPGFLFYYKGHLKMLDIVYKLKQKYSDVQYIIQGSENPNCIEEHNNLYNELYEKAKKLDLVNNITINRGFVSNDVLFAHIRTVKCCVLPYMRNEGHEVRATSGMARMVLATKTPLVVSDAHLFDDVKDITLYSNNEQEIYDNIEKVFDNKIDLEKMYKDRTEFIEKNCWENIAISLNELFNSRL